jgi:large subunit ribosomal protein L5
MRLYERYQKEVIPSLKKEFGYTNRLAIPKILKVSLNVGVGRMTKDKAFIDAVVSTLTRISGQKPMLTKSRKSISAFKVREGNIVGVAVTLRGARMYDFLDKLINVTFPRVRDFRGISDTIIDRTGNISIGFREHLAFPEVKADEVDSVHGLEINITTTAKTKAEGLALLTLLGLPFKKSV